MSIPKHAKPRAINNQEDLAFSSVYKKDGVQYASLRQATLRAFQLINQPTITAAEKQEFLDLLDSETVDVQAKASKQAETLAHLAARNGFDWAIKPLLEHGAKLYERDDVHFWPIHTAARYGHVNVMQTIDELLPEHHYAKQPTMFAGIIDNALTLIPNTSSTLRDTPLHVALYYKQPKVVEWLLDHPDGKKTLREENHDYEQPIHLAAKRGVNLGVMKMLDNAGADMHVKTGGTELQSLVHCAAIGGNKRVMEWLLNEKHLSANDPDGQGRLPIHLAVACANASIIPTLVQAGNSVEALDDSKISPIHSFGSESFCTQKNVCDTLIALLQAGANPNRCDDTYDATSLNVPLDRVLRQAFHSSPEQEITQKRLIRTASVLLEHGARHQALGDIPLALKSIMKHLPTSDNPLAQRMTKLYQRYIREQERALEHLTPETATRTQLLRFFGMGKLDEALNHPALKGHEAELFEMVQSVPWLLAEHNPYAPARELGAFVAKHCVPDNTVSDWSVESPSHAKER